MPSALIILYADVGERQGSKQGSKPRCRRTSQTGSAFYVGSWYSMGIEDLITRDYHPGYAAAETLLLC